MSLSLQNAASGEKGTSLCPSSQTLPGPGSQGLCARYWQSRPLLNPALGWEPARAWECTQEDKALPVPSFGPRSLADPPSDTMCLLHLLWELGN